MNNFQGSLMNVSTDLAVHHLCGITKVESLYCLVRYLMKAEWKVNYLTSQGLIYLITINQTEHIAALEIIRTDPL